MKIKQGTFKLLSASDFKAIDKPDYEEPPWVWRCYSCGSTEGFTTHHDEWTGEYDVECNKCGSDYTFADGEGEPMCECGEAGWDCFKCNKFCCEECWTWFSKREYHEEEDYICNDCSGDMV